VAAALAVLAALLAALLGLLVLLLALPLGLAFSFEGCRPFKGRVAVRWAFGLVRFGFSVPGKEREPKPPKKHARPKRERKKRGRRANVLAALRQAAFRRRALRLIRDLLAALHPRDLRLHARLGLGDPADTGRLWALVGPLGALARDLRHAELRIEPVFEDATLEFRGEGRLSVIPLQLVALALGFVLSPASLRAWYAMRAGRG